MLGRIECCQQVTFDEYKWKVSYKMPAYGGKDYWTKKMEERIEKEKEEAESLKAKKKSREFSWKRKSGKTRGGSVRDG